ncbi:hypothetical protein GGR58DRAFT_61870 [Xylaria digitata]|nr:hypothetical protein GGR58DRAFT_61870 [Xylaria digitata]
MGPNNLALSILLHHEAGDQYTRTWLEWLLGLNHDFRSEGYAGFYALKTLSTFRYSAGHSLENSIFLKISNESVAVWDIPPAQFTAIGERYFPTGSRVPYQISLVVSTQGFLLKIWFRIKSQQGKDHEILPWCKCEVLSELDGFLSTMGATLPSLPMEQDPSVAAQLAEYQQSPMYMQPHMYSSPPTYLQPPTYSLPTTDSPPAIDSPQTTDSQPTVDSNAPIDLQQYVLRQQPMLLDGTLDHGLRWSLQDCHASDKVDINSNSSLQVNITPRRREGYDTFDLVIYTISPQS